MNFAIRLSAWDWLFGTAYWPGPAASPAQQPARLGFPGMQGYPRSLLGRFFYPLTRLVARSATSRPYADDGGG